MSAGPAQRVSRPAQYTWRSSATLRWPSAVRKAWVRWWSAGTPADRSARANPVSSAVMPCGRAARPPASSAMGAGRPRHGGPGVTGARGRFAHAVEEAAGDDRRLVLPVLEHRAEGGGGEAEVELGGAEVEQRLGPVEGLRHAGRLDQVGLAEPLRGGRHVPGEPLGAARQPPEQDRHLAFEAGMLQPVVEAAPLEGVVDL